MGDFVGGCSKCYHCMGIKQKEEFLKRLAIESHGGMSVLTLDGIDTGVMSEYEDEPTATMAVQFEHDDLMDVMLYDDVKLMIRYEDDIVKFIEDNGWEVRYPSY